MSLADIEALRQTSSDEISRLQEEAAELRDLLTDMKETKRSFTEEITTAIQEKQARTTMENRMRNKVAGLKGTKTALCERLRWLHDEDIRLSAIVGTLKVEKSDLKRENDAMVDQNAALERERQEMHADLVYLGERVRALQGKEAVLRQQAEAAQEDVSTLSRERDGLQLGVLSTRAQLGLLAEQMTAAKCKLEALQSQQLRPLVHLEGKSRVEATPPPMMAVKHGISRPTENVEDIVQSAAAARQAFAARTDEVERQWQAVEAAAQSLPKVEPAKEREGQVDALGVKRWRWW